MGNEELLVKTVVNCIILQTQNDPLLFEKNWLAVLINSSLGFEYWLFLKFD